MNQQQAEQPILPGMPEDEPVLLPTQEALDALRQNNEKRLVRIQQTSGQQMDPSGIVMMTLIDHCFDDESRLTFLFDLETRISESLDQFETQNTLLIAQPNVPGGVNNLF